MTRATYMAADQRTDMANRRFSSSGVLKGSPT